MNKSYLSIMLLLSCAAQQSLYAMDPMNDKSFYDDKNPFWQANQLYDQQKWVEAVHKYRALLQDEDVGQKALPQEVALARVNLASCLTALRQPTHHWAAVDTLFGIAKERQLDRVMIKQNDVNGSILVRTDKIGLGDIAHLAQAVKLLKEQTKEKVTLSLRPMMHWLLKSFAQENDITLVSEKEKMPDAVYETHLFSLLGLLKLKGSDLNPEKPFFTAPEQAMGAVRTLLDKHIEGGHPIAAIFLGEKREAVVVGGRKLSKRHLDPKFKKLLEKHPQLLLLDCGTKDSKIPRDQEYLNDRVIDMPAEKDAFDVLVALAGYINADEDEDVVALAADQGPANIFARALDNDHQDQVAFIIPEASQHDMRMNGQGQNYTHMFSQEDGGWPVYRCTTRDDQESVFVQAYDDMQ